ncbi:alpha/beta hydrolase [Flavobacterium sp.]|uniref:alpha/beta hydrolase n=1 Tax=Flavobacterium sp. TaxID=239 RepID=UPI00260DA1F8|nr:alpha/beta hydrolase [Flavobacterium sp.]MDG2431558.1 alpha/beta hydrolase [Flavobacterium sp.]
MRYCYPFMFLLFVFTIYSCSTKKITDVSYLPSSKSAVAATPKLNVFVPRKSKKESPILIFVHGGYWNSGRKGTYDLMGRNFARKGVVTVIPDYTLSPNASYDEMTAEIAAVIKWVQENAKEYKGNPKQIFITGHSAGGHLAALAVMNPKYGIEANAISGIILNDAAGLNMKDYLEKNPPTEAYNYISTWTTSPEKWKDASPIYFIDKNTPPFLIYVGEQTYGSIKTANKQFLEALKPFQPNVSPIYINKKHVPMVTQYFYPWNDRIDEVIKFMDMQINKK